ncbi:MAG: DUF6049 family protein [Actinomycetota bacterium]
MTILRALGALTSLLIVASTLLVPGSASGQEPVVEFTLQAQTPYTTLDKSTVKIVVRARNTGDTPIEDLSVGFIIGQEIRSRLDYENSLVEGPTGTLIYLDTYAQQGAIDPGATRTFRILLDLDAIDAVSDTDSLVYPARVDLRSGGTQIATLDTPLVHLVRAPEVPIRLAWWPEFGAPVAFDPQGRLDDPAFEAAIAPGGGLAQQVEAIATSIVGADEPVAIDLVVVPAVLDQLDRMSDGYERVNGEVVKADDPPATDAAALLRSLREIASEPDVGVVATPFAAPLLPSLLSGGLAPDLERQEALGAATIDARLTSTPSLSTARPPSGEVDDASLTWLAGHGVTTILADPDTVERPPQPNDFAPPPVATSGADTGVPLHLVLPDPDLQGLLGDPVLLADPVRAAQAVFGELATIWREQPVPGPQPDGTETVRGVAVAMPASLPPDMWRPLLRRLSEGPFLRTAHADEFAEQINPVQEAGEVVASTARFPRDYVEAIRQEHRDVTAFRSMLVDPSPQPDRLERNLLYAQAGQYVAEPLVGRRWYDQVNAATDSIFRRVLPDVQQAFLMTSTEGSLPLRMGDPGPTPLTVRVQLRSSSFDFPGGGLQTVTLTGPDQIVTFDVVAKASGPQTIRVKTKAPSGRDLGDDQNLAVRTTAVNAVALWITAGAGVLLLLLWSRRFVRRLTR